MPYVGGEYISPEGYQGDLVRLQEELEEHFPWQYTEYGTLCACGRPVTISDYCCIAKAIEDRIAIFDGSSDGPLR